MGAEPPHHVVRLRAASRRHPPRTHAGGGRRPRGGQRLYPHARGMDAGGQPLRSPFTVPFSWANRQVLLRIDGASAGYEVRIGGRTAAYVADGNAPAEINVTRMVREGRNELEIVVDTPHRRPRSKAGKATRRPPSAAHRCSRSRRCASATCSSKRGGGAPTTATSRPRWPSR